MAVPDEVDDVLIAHPVPDVERPALLHPAVNEGELDRRLGQVLEAVEVFLLRIARFFQV